jgi:hypothetical protein
MSKNKSVGDMDEVVKIYLDCMVEMDRWLKERGISLDGTQPPVSNTAAPVSGTGGAAVSSNDAPALAVAQHPVSNTAAPVSGTGGAAVSSNDAPAMAANGTQPQSKRGRKRKRTSKSPKKKGEKDAYNFCKGNSLGILSVAAAHRYHGPAVLHWEGDWAGERKIQPMKPVLSIKRSNADWQKLVLESLLLEDKLSDLIDQLNNDLASSREIEGMLRIYSNRADALAAISSNKPLSGMLDKDGSVWIAYRLKSCDYDADTSKTTSKSWSRSALQLVKLSFDDDSGSLVSHLCWFAPIEVEEGETMTLGCPQELNLYVDQYLLLLPKLGVGDQYLNMYYAIGSKWTQRVTGGSFEQPQLPGELFNDWLGR